MTEDQFKRIEQSAQRAVENYSVSWIADCIAHKVKTGDRTSYRFAPDWFISSMAELSTKHEEPVERRSSHALNKKVPISRERIESMRVDSEDEAIEIMKDNGIIIAPTLKKACEIYWKDEHGDIDAIMQAIDHDFGDGIGVYPLIEYDWTEQQQIFLEWAEKYHPEALEDYEASEDW